MQYILSVSEVNRYVKEIICRDLILTNLWVKGEMSNYKPHYSGHMYFTLKDDKGLLKCVMFKSHAGGLKFSAENGMKVIIRGYISVFERDGQYQLYVEEMQPDGIGSLHIAFEQLKKKLNEEGLFDESIKKPIPFLPRNIGVVTSVTGAVIKDIIHVLNRRFRNVHLKIYPVQVQGDLAAQQIARAVRRLNELDCVDVIIIARGGGSLEELWAFNEEIVARSVYASRIPVISAVGHETDFTICDFTADLRAPTPSAAAELVVPEKQMLIQRLVNLDVRLKNALYQSVNMKRMKLQRLQESTVFRQPMNRIYQERMRLDALNKSILNALLAKKERANMAFAGLVGKLEALSPLNTMARGYGIVRAAATGKVLKSVKGIRPGECIEVRLKDGKLSCSVNTVDEEETG